MVTRDRVRELACLLVCFSLCLVSFGNVVNFGIDLTLYSDEGEGPSRLFSGGRWMHFEKDSFGRGARGRFMCTVVVVIKQLKAKPLSLLYSAHCIFYYFTLDGFLNSSFPFSLYTLHKNTNCVCWGEGEEKGKYVEDVEKQSVPILTIRTNALCGKKWDCG